jgi:hypothetical protein
MPAFLTKVLLPLAPYLAAGFFLIAGTAYILHLQHALQAQAAANAALLQTNQANAAEIAAYQAQSVKWNAALATLDAQTSDRAHEMADVYQRIDTAPAASDAPVAPVLAQALADIAKLQAVVK